MKPINKFLLCCFLLLTLGTDLYAQRYNVHYIMNSLRNKRDDLTLVCAHRGMYRDNPQYPENSAGAVLWAAYNNAEITEIDVRSTSDGVPILSHDETLGRLVWGFNTTNNNPYTWQRTWNDLKWRDMRNDQGRFTDEKVTSLEQVLQLIEARRVSMVLFLDIKDLPTAQRCWNIVQRYSNAWGTPASEWVVFKMNPYMFRNSVDMERQMGLRYWWERQSFKFIPAFSTGMHFNDRSPISIYDDYKKQPYFVAVEVEIKQWNRRLQNLVTRVRTSSNHGLVVFQPVPEVGNNRYYNGKNGQCCQTLDQHYAKGDLPDTGDNRPDLNFLHQQGFSCVITDRYFNATDFFYFKKKRNIMWMRQNHGRLSNEEELAASTEGAYPNPTNGPLTLSLPTDSAGTAQLSLFDLQGKNVLVKSELLQAGNNEVTLDLKEQGAKPGIYMLQAILPNQRRKTFKIVVQ